MTDPILNWHDKPVILASNSPRRKQILKLTGIQFRVHPSGYHEQNNPDQTPQELVQLHAFHKARDVAGHYRDAWIIGADTIVVKDYRILEKPNDRIHAIDMLKLLSNATHQVYTGFTVFNSINGKYFSGFEKTDVRFRKLAEQEIRYYIDHYAPFDKAGSYGIQDYSAIFVEKIDGCFYNVVGFPIAKFIQFCRQNLDDLL
jgi:septum formation protein